MVMDRGHAPNPSALSTGEVAGVSGELVGKDGADGVVGAAF